jgi:hypothetical protein
MKDSHVPCAAGKSADVDALRKKSLFRSSDKKNSLAPSGKSSAHFRPSRFLSGGAYRDRHERGSGMRWPRSARSMVIHADGRADADGEIVWSWRPGAGAKRAGIDVSARDRGKKAGPWGDHV